MQTAGSQIQLFEFVNALHSQHLPYDFSPSGQMEITSYGLGTRFDFILYFLSLDDRDSNNSGGTDFRFCSNTRRLSSSADGFPRLFFIFSSIFFVLGETAKLEL